MTPVGAAKTHCANYQADGSCLGVYYNDDLSVDRSHYAPCTTCLVAEEKRCAYFEEIIVTMRLEQPADANALASAVGTYQRKHKLQPVQRLCPKCGEEPLQARQKFCATCRVQNRRQSHRKYNSHRLCQLGLAKTTV